MNVTHAVVLAAGYGTRMLPATKAVPKELLPLVDTPVIDYIVSELVDSGIEHIVIVTAAGKRAVEDYFGRVHDLEQLLESREDLQHLARVRRTWQMADIAYVRQHEMGGIAHAVLATRHIVRREPFVLVLPDDVIVGAQPAARQLLNVFERHQASVVCVERIPMDRISAYGVIKGQSVEAGVYRVEALVEKPSAADAPSDLGIVGRYVFTPAIFDAIARTPRGAGGELQITDAMSFLLEQEPLYAVAIEGQRYDTGQPLGYLQAGIEIMLRRPEYAYRLRDYLSQLVESDLFRAVESDGKKGSR